MNSGPEQSLGPERRKGTRWPRETKRLTESERIRAADPRRLVREWRRRERSEQGERLKRIEEAAQQQPVGTREGVKTLPILIGYWFRRVQQRHWSQPRGTGIMRKPAPRLAWPHRARAWLRLPAIRSGTLPLQ